MPQATPPSGRWWIGLAVAALFGVYGAWRNAVPGVNEPHYLTKAKHFWQPDWCARDLFLQSTDAHWVFYATVGALTRFATLEQTAWVGRLLTWTCLGVGWVAMTAPLGSSRWGPVASAAWWAALATIGNLSGEWVLGGVEAKGLAYAALFLSLGLAARGHATGAAVATGTAISLHPIIGVWGLAALLFAAAGAHKRPVARGGRNRKLIAPAVVALACSLPGLVPAIALLRQPAPADVSRAADAIQVFDRLDHHLDPLQFGVRAWVWYGVLLMVWLTMRPWKGGTAAERLFFRFVVATLLIALAGLAIGLGPRWAGLLKFYPFRLADVFLPVAVAVGLTERILRAPSAETAWRARTIAGCALAAAVLWLAFDAKLVERPVRTGPSRAALWSTLLAREPREPAWSLRQQEDWHAVCRWIADNTPADALFVSPRFLDTFRWHAGRATYAVWKDCPQDAASLVEWRRRLDAVHRWRTTHPATGFDQSALDDLRALTGADYLVAWTTDRFDTTPVFANRWFHVYRLRPE